VRNPVYGYRERFGVAQVAVNQLDAGEDRLKPTRGCRLAAHQTPHLIATLK